MNTIMERREEETQQAGTLISRHARELTRYTQFIGKREKQRRERERNMRERKGVGGWSSW